MTLSHGKCLHGVERRLLDSEKQKLWYLFERIAPNLRRVAMAVLPHCLRDESDDIVQEVFLFYARQSRNGECVSLDNQRIRDIKDSDLPQYVAASCAYLTGVLLNKCRQVRRQAQQHAICDTDTVHAALCECAGPELGMEEAEKQRLIRNAVADLPETLSEVTLLYYYGRLSGAEIAAALDIPEGTVKSRLFSSRRQLRKPLEMLFAEYA